MSSWGGKIKKKKKSGGGATVEKINNMGKRENAGPGAESKK